MSYTKEATDNKTNDFQQELIQRVLLESGVLKPEHIEKALQVQKKYILEGRKKLDLFSYIPNQENCSLLVKNSVTGNLVEEISLPYKKKNPPNFNATDWFPYSSNSVAIFSDEDCQEVGELTWDSSEKLGLTIAKDFSYLQIKNLENSYCFPVLSNLQYELFPSDNIHILPLDLTATINKKYLYLVDRGGGILYLFDTEQVKLAGAVHLRPAGSKKTLNIASSYDGKKVFVTDNQTTALYTVETKTLKIKKQPLPYGILCNICSDERWLYMLVNKAIGAPEILVMDQQNLIIRATIQLRGSLFSEVEDPSDLMTLSPTGKFLLVMTYVNYPTPYTPVVNVIDLKEFEWVDQIFLTDKNKPTYISFAMNKPDELVKLNSGLIDILIELGYITEEHVLAAIDKIQGVNDDYVPVKKVPKKTVEPETSYSQDDGFALLDSEMDMRENADQGTLTSEEKYPVLHKYELDPSLLLAFKEEQMLHFSFLPINKIDGKFTIAIANPTYKEVLRNALTQKFQGLEIVMVDFNIIEFKRFMQEFYAVIKEKYEAITSGQPPMPPQEVKKQEANPKLVSNLPKEKPANLKPLPQNMIKPKTELPPNASANIPSDVRVAVREKLKTLDPGMLDEAIMSICMEDFQNIWGIEPERKDVLKHKKTLEKARIEILEKDYAFIKIENFVGQFSLEIVVNQEKLVVMLKSLSEIAQKQTKDEPAKPVRKTGYIASNEEKEEEEEEKESKCQKCGTLIPPEIDICSKCSREKEQNELGDDVRAPASPSPLANLNEGHLLVSDIVRHRVIELNDNGQINWQLGGKDKKEYERFAPYSAIRLRSGTTLVTDSENDRVIEFTKSGIVYWELKNREGFRDLFLRRPVQAIRLLNGNTLIVDQGNHRVFEVNHLDKIVWQYGITSTVGCNDGKLYSPSHVQRLSNGHTLIADTDNHRVIEIDENDQVVWQYGNPKNKLGSGYGEGRDQLNGPLFATKLESGNVLIVDPGNYRIIEVNQDKQVVWNFYTTIVRGSPINIVPFRAYRLRNSHTVIISSDQIIEINDAGQLMYIRQTEYLSKSPTFKEASFPGEDNPRINDLVNNKSGEKAKLATDAYVKTMSNLSEINVPLIDKANHRVYVINRYKNIIWRFGDPEESSDNFLERPQCIELISDEYALIADTDNHRVIKIYRPTKEIVWSYGISGAMGSGNNQLGHPRSATLTPDNNILVTDQYTARVLEINPDKQIVWSFGGWEHGNSPINAPYYAQRIFNNNTLITDWSNHIVIEVDMEGNIVWQYGTTRQSGKTPNHLMYPEKAIRLDNGNTLIADTRNNRVIELNDANRIIWEFINYRSGTATRQLSSPTNVIRLENGHTLIVHNSNKQIIEVSKKSEVVWQYQSPIDKR